MTPNVLKQCEKKESYMDLSNYWFYYHKSQCTGCRVLSHMKTGIDTRSDGQWQRRELRPFSPAESHNTATPVHLKKAITFNKRF